MKRWLCVFVLSFTGVFPVAAHAMTGSQFMAAASKAPWIAEGHGTRVVYVIFDPNCPFCHLVWKESQAHLKNTQFRWIVVGFLRPSSPAKAAAILQSHDRLAAFIYNESHFVRARGKLGAIAPAAHILPGTAAALKADQALLTASGGQRVVPKIIFMDKTGTVQVIEGALRPSDFSATLHEVSATKN